MPVEEATRAVTDVLAPEDELRAQMYRFLARLLAAPPNESLLKSFAGMEGDQTDLGKAMLTFGKLASKTDLSQV